MSARPFGKPSARPAPQRSRFLRLAAIASAAGPFSGLFAAVQLMFAWQLAKKAGLR